MQLSTFKEIMRGHDAVVSGIGAISGKLTTLYSGGVSRSGHRNQSQIVFILNWGISLNK